MKEAEESAKAKRLEAASSSTEPGSEGKQTSDYSWDTANLEHGSPEEEWNYLKRAELARSDEMDTLMGMIGLEDVKRAFLDIKSTVDTATRQGVSTNSERFGCSLLGNPGTGKTTVARLYARFLTSMGVIAGSCFKEMTGPKLASMGPGGAQQLLDSVLEEGGGVIFIDEAYQLSSGNSPGGRAVMDFLLAEVENLNGKICFVLAGYTKPMEQFFAHNPGLPSRFPREMKFNDYTDEELLRILELKVNFKYGGRMRAEDGLRGLYFRIVARRLGRGRGKEGFGNARAAENVLSKVYRRQSERLRRERRAGLKPDDLLLTKEDLIGPEPTGALRKSDSWTELQKLVGLDSVKKSVRSLVDSIQTNYQRELAEEPTIEYSLNRVFLGNPGTGKTTVAKIYGQILVDLGLLSNGEVVVKNPSDFVGGALGQSEQQTKGVLNASMGKVLVIDEAYGLYGGGTSDPYKTAVVDTIVAEEDVPFNFLFRGPPGTGKSTTASKMGKVFYDAGFLASGEVMDCSASDIIGQYVGQTGPKVRQQLDRALGRVLLIDEAYRLAEGHFAKEALDELVDAVTKERYHKRLVIILAGYEDDINRLLSVNPGLTSRFPECIDFQGLVPQQCFDLLVRKLLKKKRSVEGRGKGAMDVTALEEPSSDFHTQVIEAFDAMSQLPGWASARDVETVAKSVFQRAIKSVSTQKPEATIVISEEVVVGEIAKMVRERQSRAQQSKPSMLQLVENLPLPQTQAFEPQPQKPNLASAQGVSTATSFQVEEQTAQDPGPSEETDHDSDSGSSSDGCRVAVRDAGVSDEVWDQLQQDAEAEERREGEYQAKLKAKREAEDDALRDQIVKELVEEEERRKREAEMRKKLELGGRCPVGYHWIRQQGGWRCAGGSHYVPDGEM
ncbi:Stage V sporulation protein K-like protein [Hapsidospora chrysogenum ATCC 11550]|uniref:Stage V sporulation protein K-like protein n=1 Tax=Hapsidospora chrysogenum (strain ATCC 11550 / CBS 779.69 / DSM 880 / IAM 14645 / JCM 23072 / IMI 49137) TaxID=857340 RepID=A0A086T619_HAPC1|nr:Stage V sporulation protein K-like protein [Hapsidospora chrysogenum ATCC 11550]